MGITETVRIIVETVSKNTQKVLTNTVKNLKNLDNRTIQLSNRTKMLSRSLKGTTNQFLGLMFFAMATSHAISGLLKPALDATGVFDLWGTTLTVVFLPVVLAILPALISMMTFLMNLSEPAKMVIGVMTILIGIIAAVTAVIIGIALAAASPFAALAIAIAAAVAIVGTIIALLVDLIVKNWNNIVAFFVTVGTAIWNAIKSVWQGISDFFVKLWDGIKSCFKTAFDWLLNLFLNWTLIGIIIKNWDAITKFFTDLWDGIKKIFSDAWDFLSGIFDKIVNGIKNAIDWGKNLIGIGDKANNSGASGNNISIPKNNDFVWRSGQGAVAINPNDNLIGFKGNNAPGGSGVVINQNLTITGSMKEEVAKIINESNKRLVDDIRRMTGVRGA